jgi:DNA-binding transcriptional MerR regulator
MTDEVRIDELARQVGLPSSTLRLYRHRGLLPPPRLEGRVGWYGQVHRDRLALIARLQEQGHSLAGIKQLVDSWDEGGDLATVVGVESGLAALLGGSAGTSLTLAELAQRLPDDAADPATLLAAVQAGLIELRDDGTVVVPDARFLELGAAVGRIGIASRTIVDEWAELRRATDDVAERFVAVFEEEILGGPVDALAPDELVDVAEQLVALHRLARQAVELALDASLAAVARDRLGTVAAALAGRTTDEGGHLPA